MNFMVDCDSPENLPTVSISLTVKDGNQALDFYQRAFGAEVRFKMPMPDGGIAHSEFMIGNTRLMLSGESPEWSAFAMPEGTMSSNLLSIVAPDCDASYQQALDAGATSLSAPQNQFWGARSAVIKDPFGYRWSFIQQVEDVSPEEIMERAKKLFG